MNTVLSRLPNVGTTIFTVMSQLAAEYNAINLGQGFPDFDMNEKLVALVNEAMLKGHNQYVHTNGLALLRQRIAEKIKKLYHTSINPETEITITPGGTYAIYTSLTAILQKDDEVIVFEPAYDSYIPNIEVNYAKAITIPLQYPSYTIPWEQVKQRITPKTRAIILNSPHNPTGMVLRQSDIDALREIIHHSNIFIISDEVYEHLIFDELPHLSMLRYPDLMERSFVCFSFGKTYNCTGWKIGYCVAPAYAMNEFRKVHQFNCFSCNSPVQYALAEFLQDEHPYLSLSKKCEAKRNYFQELMLQTNLTPIHSFGSYFQCYSYASISNESDKMFAIRLTKEAGVATVPMSAFYKQTQDNKVLRFCFVKKDSTLEEAVSRLKKFFC